ncbi:pvalb7, partial [Symbiodinium sp. KB8]
MSTRYTGFRASTAQQLTAEPGTSKALRRDRFLILTETVTPPPAIASELAATGKSVAQVDAEARRPEDFHVPELGGSMTAKRLQQRPPPRPARARSAYASDFPDFRADASAMAELSDDSIRAAFAATDADKSGFVEDRELPELLRRLLGREPSAHQSKCLVAAFDRNRDGRISLEELLEGWPTAVRVITAESRVSLSRSKPKFKAEQGKEVLGSGPLLSTSQADFGRFGEVPGKRPPVDPARGTMRGTTDDVSRGTVKTTRHPPGYMGFTAASTSGEAHRQSFGAEARDTFAAKTNLLATMGAPLTGYTGHVPAGRSLCKPPGATDIGAADMLVEAYWAAR